MNKFYVIFPTVLLIAFAVYYTQVAKPEMADRILARKIDTIRATGAELLVTGNPGCLLQLKKGLAEQLPEVGIVHVTELLARSLDGVP